MHHLNRRELLKNSLAASAVVTTLPSLALGNVASNDKLNLAVIGCANRGGAIGAEARRFTFDTYAEYYDRYTAP